MAYGIPALSIFSSDSAVPMIFEASVNRSSTYPAHWFPQPSFLWNAPPIPNSIRYLATVRLEIGIPASCKSMGNAFSGCKFLTGDLMIHCTSKTTLSNAFSGAATTGNGLNVILSYDSEKEQETANMGLYGTSKTASEILQSLKSSLEGSLSSGSHITVTINTPEEKTKE